MTNEVAIIEMTRQLAMERSEHGIRVNSILPGLIGAGVALGLGASAPSTVLGFAILVGLGVVVSGWALLGRLQVRP